MVLGGIKGGEGPGGAGGPRARDNGGATRWLSRHRHVDGLGFWRQTRNV